MTRKEAIDMCMEVRHYLTSGNPIWDKDKVGDAFDMAIEALRTPPISQRSMYQKGYEQGREEALKQVTGKLKNPDDSLFTADPEACKEQKSKLDLISRADAIEAIEIVDWYHQNSNKDMVHGANDAEHQAWYKADDVYKALEAVPSVNRPKDGDLISRTEAIEALGEEPLVWCDEEYEIAERNQWRDDVEVIKSVPSADRPRGRWHYSDGKPATIGQSFGVICDQCGTESEYCTNFCPNCGADMRGEDK